MKGSECVCREGFTLVEMLLVVLIIGILSAVVMAYVPRVGDDTRIAATRATLASIHTAIARFEGEVGRWPETLHELVIEGDEKWPGPFLDCEDVPRDGWGHEFKYEVVGKRVRVTSPGRDGQFGTDDDLWK